MALDPMPNFFRRQRHSEERLNALFKQHCLSFFNYMFGDATRYSVNAMVIARLQKNGEDRPNGCMLRFEHDNIPTVFPSDDEVKLEKRKMENEDDENDETPSKKPKVVNQAEMNNQTNDFKDDFDRQKPSTSNANDST